jgi:RHS repeat-associated protein
VSDKKIAVSANGTTVDYYTADVVTANDYYPFGSQMPGRKYSQPNSSYRYGFNGQENDNSTGEGNLDFGARIYDGRVGKFLSLDPLMKKYPNESNYAFVSNSPLLFADFDGRKKIIVITIIGKDGKSCQIRKIDKNYFEYDKHYTSGGTGAWYFKESVMVHLIIDNRSGEGNLTAQDALDNPNRFQYEVTRFDRVEVSLAEFIGGCFKNFIGANSGDQSESTQVGYRMYGEGKDMAWQDGLPRPAPGVEGNESGTSIDLQEILNAAGVYREYGPKAEPFELMTNPTLKKLFEGADNILDAAQTAKDANKLNTENSKPNVGKTDAGSGTPYKGKKEGTIIYEGKSADGKPIHNKVNADGTGTCCQQDKPATDTGVGKKGK